MIKFLIHIFLTNGTELLSTFSTCHHVCGVMAVSSILVARGLDVKHHPTRNSGSTRRFVRVASLPPSLKCMAGLKLANITLYATCIVLLTGDIQQKPGPAENYSCSRVCRNESCAGPTATVKYRSCTNTVKISQSRASCSLCLVIFHLRCMARMLIS